MTPVRTRFAPSPTGSLHIGGVRTALYCLLWARRTGGRFLLRIEDTDQARSTEEAANGILRDMRWVGLEWDEGPDVGGPVGPYFQSQRLAIYDEHLETLLASGKAYHAWETGDELAAERKAAEARKQTFLYRRRAYSDADLARFEAEGRRPVVRLETAREAITVADRVLGDVKVEGDQLDDLVLRKADGFPTYHFAVVVDDHLMGVALVLRGQEHLMNTHKHEGICRALGWVRPECGHLPLIFNPSGTKMSKRDKAKFAREALQARLKAEPTEPATLADRLGLSSPELAAFLAKKSDAVSTAEAVARALDLDLPRIEVADFRRGGYIPEALLNYLLLLGWNPGDDRELYSLPEMVDAFEIERINKTAARFDATKLEWMNGEYMKRLPLERLLDLHDQYLAAVPRSPMFGLSRASRVDIFALWRERAATFAKLDQMARFLFHAPAQYEPKAVQKHLADGGLERLSQAAAAFEAVEWTAAALEAAIAPFTDGTPAGMGRYAQPLRVAITGSAVSPPIYDVLAWLGRDESLARIAAARAHLG